MSAKAEDDGWVFDTVKAPPSNNGTTRRIPSSSFDQENDSASRMEELQCSMTSVPTKPVANSTVRRTPARDGSPSIRRVNTKRRSSGIKQPLGLDLSYGNSPSTVRQFRRVSDRVSEDHGWQVHSSPGMDENMAPKTLFSEPNTKEGQLGRRAYSKGIGLACQEILANTSDHEKREVIARLAEAFSDLEMIDPEGLFHILKLSNEKIKSWVSHLPS
jgi:serine/threonine-protein kinase 24/25/MST4